MKPKKETNKMIVNIYRRIEDYIEEYKLADCGLAESNIDMEVVNYIIGLDIRHKDRQKYINYYHRHKVKEE